MFRAMINKELLVPIYKETKSVKAFYVPYSDTFILYVKTGETWKDINIKMNTIHQIDTRVRGVIRRFYRRKHA